MSISYLNISKEELEKLYKEFGTQQKIADYLKVPVYKVKRLIGKYQLYLNKASLTKNKKAIKPTIEAIQTIQTYNSFIIFLGLFFYKFNTLSTFYLGKHIIFHLTNFS